MLAKGAMIIGAMSAIGCFSYQGDEPVDRDTRLGKSGPTADVGEDDEAVETQPTGGGSSPSVVGSFSSSIAGGDLDAGTTSGSSSWQPSAGEDPRGCIEARLRAAADGGVDGGAGGEADAGASHAGSLEIDLGTGDLTVLVIFDKSGSMGSLWDERTKWEVANDAFEKGLIGILDVVTMGAILFPQPGACDVAPLDSELQFGFTSGRSFWTRWENTAAERFPNGSTPLELAFRTADAAIEAACRRGLLDERFRVLLVTDGEPTCNDDLQGIVDMAAEWGHIGVETRVLGLPGSSGAAALLDAIANGGGTIEHEEIESTQQLDDSVYAALR